MQQALLKALFFLQSLTKKNMLNTFCTAIRDNEGVPGDRNYRNNNPGNCKFSDKGYLPKYGTVTEDKDGFAVFKDYATGWLYLQNLVRSKIELHPNQTIYGFFCEYAPSSDNNDPLNYAQFVARRCGLTVDTPVKVILN